MKKFIWLLLATMLAACGGGGQDSKNTGGTGTTPTTPGVTEVIPQGAERDRADVVAFSYNKDTGILTIFANMDKVVGSTANPFIYGSFDNWGIKNDLKIASGSKWAVIAFKVTPGQVINFVFGGDKLILTWADATSSDFWKVYGNDKYLQFTVAGTQPTTPTTPTTPNTPTTPVVNPPVTTINVVPAALPNFPAGTVVDTQKTIGFSVVGGQLTIYANLAKVAGSLAHPFVFGSMDDWGLKHSMTKIPDTTWASVTFAVTNGQVINFVYGGDSNSPQSWADSTSSQFWKVVGNDKYLSVRIGGNTVTAN